MANKVLIDYRNEIVPGCKFVWKEYAYLHDWDALLIPSPEEIENAKFLFSNLRDYIRVPLNKSLIINSGARNRNYTLYLIDNNIPAALGSAHNEWKAVDLAPPAGMTNAQFWAWCAERWPGRMENLAHTPGWVHLDTRNWGSRQRFNP